MHVQELRTSEDPANESQPPARTEDALMLRSTRPEIFASPAYSTHRRAAPGKIPVEAWVIALIYLAAVAGGILAFVSY